MSAMVTPGNCFDMLVKVSPLLTWYNFALAFLATSAYESLDFLIATSSVPTINLSPSFILVSDNLFNSNKSFTVVLYFLAIVPKNSPLATMCSIDFPADLLDDPLSSLETINSVPIFTLLSSRLFHSFRLSIVVLCFLAIKNKLSPLATL